MREPRSNARSWSDAQLQSNAQSRSAPGRVAALELAAALGLAACVLPPPEPAGMSRARPDLGSDLAAGSGGVLQRLAQDTGARWQARMHPEGGIARLENLDPARTAPIGDPARTGITSAAERFVQRYPALFGLRPGDELRSGGTRRDGLGMLHVTLQQQRGGAPVVGGGLGVHLDARGAVVRIHGRIVPLAAGAIPAPATLSAEAARQQGLAAVAVAIPGATLAATKPDVVVLPGSAATGATGAASATGAVSDAPRLAWRVEVTGQGPQLPVWHSVYVDAALTAGGPAAVLRIEDRLRFLDRPEPATGSGQGALGDRRSLAVTLRGDTYWMEDPMRGGARTTTVKPAEQLPGRTVQSGRADQWDLDGPTPGLAVDVHAHVATVWDYYARRHGRFGPGGNGQGPVAVVRYGAVLGLYDGRRLLFGGAAGDAQPGGVALDVVAHEYTHAVLAELADLGPSAQSAAIEEGLADALSCLIEREALGAGGDWTVGERVPGLLASGGVRDLIDPRRVGQARLAGEFQPIAPSDPILRRRQLAFHAGIVGHAGYELARRLDDGRAGALLYRAAESYLGWDASFADFSDGVLAAAKDLYGAGAEPDAVRAAWAELGLPTVETAGIAARP